MLGFTSYWLADSEIWASKSGASCEIDLELAVGLHGMHIRAAVSSAYDGKRTAAKDHRDRADELAAIVRKRSVVPTASIEAKRFVRAGI
jgi:hypothetical protein